MSYRKHDFKMLKAKTRPRLPENDGLDKSESLSRDKKKTVDGKFWSPRSN